jgi:hypothetical protein
MNEINEINFSFLNLKKNLIENNNLIDGNIEELNEIKTREDLRLYNLLNIKKFKYNNSVYGIVHIQIKYFVKMKNYDFYLKKIDEKTKMAFDISKKYSKKEKVFIFIDLSDITQKNFSRKFIKLILKKCMVQYEDTLELCFLYGSVTFIKIVWPFVKLFLDKETKDKIVLLNN